MSALYLSSWLALVVVYDICIIFEYDIFLIWFSTIIHILRNGMFLLYFTSTTSFSFLQISHTHGYAGWLPRHYIQLFHHIFYQNGQGLSVCIFYILVILYTWLCNAHISAILKERACIRLLSHWCTWFWFLLLFE